MYICIDAIMFYYIYVYENTILREREASSKTPHCHDFPAGQHVFSARHEGVHHAGSKRIRVFPIAPEKEELHKHEKT